MIGYKIVEIKNGKVKTLYHGVNKSKEIRLNQWYRADKKMVRDGAKCKYYLSGWHFLLTEEECQNLFDDSFRVKKDRYIIKCNFRGDIRPKHNDKNGKPYYLADEIYISSADVEKFRYS